MKHCRICRIGLSLFVKLILNCWRNYIVDQFYIERIINIFNCSLQNFIGQNIKSLWLINYFLGIFGHENVQRNVLK